MSTKNDEYGWIGWWFGVLIGGSLVLAIAGAGSGVATVFVLGMFVVGGYLLWTTLSK